MKNSRFGSALLALSLAAQLAMPVAMAADTVDVYNPGGSAESEIILTVMQPACKHEKLEYRDNGDGTHDGICPGCQNGQDALVVDGELHGDSDDDGSCDKCGTSMKTDCEHDNRLLLEYRDNKDGTHSGICRECGDVVVESEPHRDDDVLSLFDGKCELCGADMTAPNPILVATVPLQLPVIMTPEGDAVTAKTAAIVNCQSRPIAVMRVEVEAEPGWTMKDMEYDFASETDDAKMFGMSFRGKDMYYTASPGLSDTKGFSGLHEYPDDNSTLVPDLPGGPAYSAVAPWYGEIWSIAGNGRMDLDMEAAMPKQTRAADRTPMASVRFVFDWSLNESRNLIDDTEEGRLFSEFSDAMYGSGEFHDYFYDGEPSEVGAIEDMLAVFGLDYEVESANAYIMHRDNLKKLEGAIKSASDSQLQAMRGVLDGKPVPNDGTNRLLLFNDFAKIVQADFRYDAPGHFSYYLPEETLHYFGVDWGDEIGLVKYNKGRHARHLARIKDFVCNDATAAQLQDFVKITNGDIVLDYFAS